MRTIDIHAHLMPQCFWKTVDAGEAWYGARFEAGDPIGYTVQEGKRDRVSTPKLRWTPEQRLKDMDAQGVDVQVISIHVPLFNYHLDVDAGRRLAEEVNDEIATMTKQFSNRFAGLATLPAQNAKAAVVELERAMKLPGIKGAALDTVVNDQSWDEPQFLPLFKAAEAMGAVLFFHPQPNDNLVSPRVKDRAFLSNSIGVPVEDALLVGTLIYGGILDRCPDLKVCIAHGGGPSCFGMGRLDRAWQVHPGTRTHIQKPPSTYQQRLYYDCLTNSEAALRFLIDQVGPDRIVLGSDWPLVKWNPSPVAWIQGLQTLTTEEKEKILWKNLEALLNLPPQDG